MRIQQVQFLQLEIPLQKPYVTSKRAITSFDPFVVVIRTTDMEGFGESLVLKGYTKEDPEASWQAGTAVCREILGLEVDEAAVRAGTLLSEHVGVASAMLCALDMLRSPDLFVSDTERHVPLLATLSAKERQDIKIEVERFLNEGYRTFKAKVGFDPVQDAQRINVITEIIAGRAGLRIDANRAFSVAEALEFLRLLNGDGIELFEQPSGADDWEANTQIASRSHVPIMLDESIYDLKDIERAAGIENVRFIKLKLKKIGSMQALGLALERIRELGMEPVLGDGVATDIGCWMEACVASKHILNAGEMNGFLKFEGPLLQQPLRVSNGSIVLAANHCPSLAHATMQRFIKRSVVVG